MGKFEFRKQGIALDIAGVQTSVPNTAEYTERLKKASEEMKAFGAQLKDEADIANGIDTMLAILDDLLGEDVMDAIEAKRTLDLYDCLDLVMYISQGADLPRRTGKQLQEACPPKRTALYPHGTGGG